MELATDYRVLLRSIIIATNRVVKYEIFNEIKEIKFVAAMLDEINIGCSKMSLSILLSFE